MEKQFQWRDHDMFMSVCGCVCVYRGGGLLVEGRNELWEVFLECRNSGWITYSAALTITTHL